MSETTVNIDYYLSELDYYHQVLMKAIKNNHKVLQNFNTAFLFEFIIIYEQSEYSEMKNSQPEFEYYAVLYGENTKCQRFYNMQFSRTNDQFKLKRVRLNEQRGRNIQKWISQTETPTRFDISEFYVDNKENRLLCVSNLTSDNTFCRVVLNPYLIKIYTIPGKQKYREAYNFGELLKDISYIFYLSGEGAPF